MRKYIIPTLVCAIVLFTGATQAATAATVTSSVLDHIVIQPNDRPTMVDIESDQQFVATAYTQENQTLTGLTFSWTVDGNVGRMSADGLFTATRGGIGRITARSGATTASVGVVVRGVAKPEATVAQPQATIPHSSTTVEPVSNTNTANDDPQITDQGEVKGETTESTPNATKSCTTIRAWLWVIICIIVAIGLFAYFLSLGESRTFWWWVWPAIITAIPMTLYFVFRCGSINLWVPWTLGVIALLLVVFYLRVLRPIESTHTPPRV